LTEIRRPARRTPLTGAAGAGPDSVVERLRKRLVALEHANRALAAEVEQHRRAEALAHGQARMLIESLEVLTNEPDIDRFLGHVLEVTVQQLEGVGGTLWFPDPENDSVRLHLEYLEARIIPAEESHHPAVLRPLPVGGRGVSTFPIERPEMYLMQDAVDGMPEVNRAYINSLGVRTLLTVPMVLGTETVGWICVRSSKDDPKEMQAKIPVAEALASQATLAVQMARLGEEARQVAVLAERNRIARDIHDTLAQGFTGVVVNLEAASRALRRAHGDVALDHIDNARGLAQSCLDEARLSVRALRPDPTRRPDLALALEAQVRRMEATGASARLRISGEKVTLPADVEAELVRIAQECITNVLKHASARNVELLIDYRSDGLSLRVTDDGAGFDTTGRHDGFGLLGMRERAERIGATLHVSSTAGRGTRVLMHLASHGGAER
jgi:signal transduction histidine kinase